MATQIPIDREAIADFCRRNHIRKLALFGSVTPDDFSPDSDVDVLVEFEPGHTKVSCPATVRTMPFAYNSSSARLSAHCPSRTSRHK